MRLVLETIMVSTGYFELNAILEHWNIGTRRMRRSGGQRWRTLLLIDWSNLDVDVSRPSRSV